MKPIAVIYWSGTGNTQAMAEAMVDQLVSRGEPVELFSVDAMAPADASQYTKLLLGCPSMGDEVLEEEEFEPFFAQLVPNLSGKKIALFGSYDWGDGQWMRDWQNRVTAAGAVLFQEGLIVHLNPDSEALDQCKRFASEFAAY